MRRSRLLDAVTGSYLSYRIPRPVASIRRIKSGAEHPICPRCRISMNREYMRFCDRCGQALAWRGYADAQIVTGPGADLSVS